MDTKLAQTYIGDTPPADLSPSVIWWSTALADARFPASAGQSILVAANKPNTQSEPNVWEFDGRYYMLTSGQQLFVADDPYGPWTNRGYVLGSGNGGEAEFAAHAGIYIEDGKLYLYYAPQVTTTQYRCAWTTLANLAGPTPALGWTLVGQILPNASGRPLSAGQWGNPAVFKWQGQYRMLVEALYGASQSWQSCTYSAPSPTGPWTLETSVLPGLYPSPALRTNPADDSFGNSPAITSFAEGYADWCSNGPIYVEKDGYGRDRAVMIYHAGPQSGGGESFISHFYRAFSYDGGLTWDIDFGGFPIWTCQHPAHEMNGVGDPFVVRFKDSWWCFWSAGNDRESKTCIRAAPLAPTPKRWNGTSWDPCEWAPRPSFEREFIPRTRYGVFGGTKVFPFDSLPCDPGATANQPVTLPPAFTGNRVRVNNITTGVGTVLVGPGTYNAVADVILGANPALTSGQVATYICERQGYWSRLG